MPGQNRAVFGDRSALFVNGSEHRGLFPVCVGVASATNCVWAILHNYFNYFTEIEEHFQRRRGTLLLLSTLDWALIETWKEAGIPLEAVLRGIDTAFDSYERRPSKTRKVNSLAFCSQEVLAAAEEIKEAAVGSKRDQDNSDTGLSAEEVSAYLTKNAALFRVA